jgi:sulfoacetaldehyde acetyltransferase
LTCFPRPVSVSSRWRTNKKNQVDFFDNRYVGTNLPGNPDYAKLAVDIGALGLRIDDPDQVGDVMKEAIASGKKTAGQIEKETS